MSNSILVYIIEGGSFDNGTIETLGRGIEHPHIVFRAFLIGSPHSAECSAWKSFVQKIHRLLRIRQLIYFHNDYSLPVNDLGLNLRPNVHVQH